MKCSSCSAELVLTIADLGAGARSARIMVDVAHPEPLCDGFDGAAALKAVVAGPPATPVIPTAARVSKGDAAS